MTDPYTHARALYEEASREVADAVKRNDSDWLNKWTDLAEALLRIWPSLAKEPL